MISKAGLAKGPLPAWAEAVRRKYLGNESSLFVLYGNVFDELLWGDRFVSLPQFLSEVLLAGNKDTIIYFDPSAGARYLKRTAASDTKPLAADKPLDEALTLLEQELFVRSSAALIVTYAGVVAPAGDDSLLAQALEHETGQVGHHGDRGRSQERARQQRAGEDAALRGG